MMSLSKRKPFYAFLFAAILLVGLALRLRGLDTTGLWGDQAFTLNTAMRWVNGGAMPLAANKSSVGFVNPPMIEYLYAAALWLWSDILSVSLLTLLGGLAAVVVTGVVTARLFGRRAALWAALALAVAPWAVFWSQLIWNQTLVPPLAALTLGGLMLYLAERPRALYLIVSLAAAAALTQVHPGTAIQLVTIALALLIFRRRVSWGHVLAGAAVFGLLYLPYLVYQIGTGWADLRAVGQVAGQESLFSSAAALLSLDLIRAQGLYRSVPGVVAFDHLATGLFLVSLALVMWRLWQQRREQYPVVQHDSPDAFMTASLSSADHRPSERIALVILWLWFLMPLLFYLRSSVYLQNYYLLGQWPAHFMFLGIGLDTAQRAAGRLAARAAMPGRRRLWAAAGLFLPILFVLSAAYQIFFTLRYQDARAAGNGPDMQVRHARAMIATSRELLGSNEAERLVGLGRGSQVESSDLALLQEFVDPNRVILADGDLALPLPRPNALFLNTRPGSLASYSLADQAVSLPDAAIPVKDQLWQFYRWAEPEAGDKAPSLASWNLGLDLVGYFPGELHPGQELIIVLTWDIAGQPPSDVYHFGVYVLDEQDAIVAQHDGPGFDSNQWRVGDGFITYHRLAIPADLPAGTYRTAIALYSWPELMRAERVGGTNTVYLETISLARP